MEGANLSAKDGRPPSVTRARPSKIQTSTSRISARACLITEIAIINRFLLHLLLRAPLAVPESLICD